MRLRGISRSVRSIRGKKSGSNFTDITSDPASATPDSVLVPFNSGETTRFNAAWKATSSSVPVTLEIGSDGVCVWSGHYSADGEVSGKMLVAFPLDEITAWRAHPALHTRESSENMPENPYFQLVCSKDLREFNRLTFETGQPAAIAAVCKQVAEAQLEMSL